MFENENEKKEFLNDIMQGFREALGIFRIEMNERFDEMDKRMDKMDVRLDKMDIRLNKLDVRLNKMDIRLDKVDVRLDGMDKRFDKVEDKLEKVEDAVVKTNLIVENRIEPVIKEINSSYQGYAQEVKDLRKIVELKKITKI